MCHSFLFACLRHGNQSDSCLVASFSLSAHSLCRLILSVGSFSLSAHSLFRLILSVASFSLSAHSRCLLILSVGSFSLSAHSRCLLILSVCLVFYRAHLILIASQWCTNTACSYTDCAALFHQSSTQTHTFLHEYCSTVQGLLDWFEVD